MRWSLVLAAALPLGGCDLDLEDPNLPNEIDVITTGSGIKNVAVGLQAEWGNSLDAPINTIGLVTDEIGAIPAAFESYRLVDAGDPVDNDLGPSSEPWGAMYDVIQVADVLLDNAPSAPLHPATVNGIVTMAKLFKGMAFGNLLEIFERIPVDVGLDNLNPNFVSRQEAYTVALQLLEEARQQVQTLPDTAEFNREVVAPGFDLKNTIDAMIARYSLAAGNLDNALAAAQRVDLGVLSEFRFSATDRNPLFVRWRSSGNAFAMRPEDRFRLSAEPGDRRVAYWAAAAAVAGSTVPLDNFVKYNVSDASFPAYFPDEMRLIRAEVAARRGDLVTALLLVNQVRTPCSSPLNEPVACLPPLTLLDVPTQAAMLEQILYEREYELYLQGVRWSDLRRFGQPVKYQFMMVPRTECDRNANAPAEVCRLQTG